MKHIHRTGAALTLCLLLTSCTWVNDDQSEQSKESDESFVPYTWVTDTTMHKIILRLVEEEDGKLETWSPADDQGSGQSSPEDEERDVDYLIKVGMLVETDDGYTITSDAELDELPGDPDIPPSVLSSAMVSILNQNDVRWCGESVRGRDFRDRYLDTHNNFDQQTYDTQEQFLESIEDYVDCGTG